MVIGVHGGEDFHRDANEHLTRGAGASFLEGAGDAEGDVDDREAVEASSLTPDQGAGALRRVCQKEGVQRRRELGLAHDIIFAGRQRG